MKNKLILGAALLMAAVTETLARKIQAEKNK